MTRAVIIIFELLISNFLFLLVFWQGKEIWLFLAGMNIVFILVIFLLHKHIYKFGDFLCLFLLLFYLFYAIMDFVAFPKTLSQNNTNQYFGKVKDINYHLKGIDCHIDLDLNGNKIQRFHLDDDCQKYTVGLVHFPMIEIISRRQFLNSDLIYIIKDDKNKIIYQNYTSEIIKADKFFRVVIAVFAIFIAIVLERKGVFKK
ncbi:hypothetical protein F1B92_08580 [Campylobacter sp. FMV-PI01]|uniref:Uncharacterized protein n=1 Tax=Campylobacter portucalensis TaxID=2608384 RepID=A0A6L5WIZ7_9BACT|nr:hypothetical protein [Campylobacter portucalensis]MSN97210.1 hypothetical protein [Campylobacter portucalensis]